MNMEVFFNTKHFLKFSFVVKDIKKGPEKNYAKVNIKYIHYYNARESGYYRSNLEIKYTVRFAQVSKENI